MLIKSMLCQYTKDTGYCETPSPQLSQAILQPASWSFINIIDLREPLNAFHTAGVRVWQGDFLDLPQYYAPFDAIVMNAVFGNMFDSRAVLLKASLYTKPGGHVVISHPLGRAWHASLAASSPDMVPHELPDQQQLEELVKDLPLELVDFRDEEELYLAVLQVSGRCDEGWSLGGVLGWRRTH